MPKIVPTHDQLRETPGLQVAINACLADGDPYAVVLSTDTLGEDPLYLVIQYEGGDEPHRIWLVRNRESQPTWGPADYDRNRGRYYLKVDDTLFYVPRRLEHAPVL